MPEPVKSRKSRVSPLREGEVFALVLDRLRAVGYELLSVGDVAADARMSKATIYRQWGGKPELVARALSWRGCLDVADIDTGTLRGDLKRLAVVLIERRDPELNRAMAQAIHRDPALLEAFRTHFLRPGSEATERLLARAVERGEVAADRAALPYVRSALFGAFMGQGILGDPLDEEWANGYVDHLIAPALGL
ncbi:TetR/AcrR family transcriptional regulator [Actinocorallia sp. A-T 12471]|uniref:TetR/AcrR family transcriptional regulator n=1 Tax=Actinocorallia sp. A-T 12471 TaxID=3089813 RepID=UPI0029D07E65|nr:TetR/AcrR family transcriptional regulator [Actinocorallia sp. A-T 12471]MDX6744108.1 TetR/AcrR family transcriptional regulator [Actinocorallia sp. A-T 12471]